MPSGGARPGSGRPKGVQNKIVEYVKVKSVSFFERILDDDTEAKFWRYFMTGYIIDTLPDGSNQIISIPVDATCWNAFRRAVEYKRGMPIQPIDFSGEITLAPTIEKARARVNG